MLETYAACFGQQALRPTDYLERDWARMPWVRGGATVAFGPGTWTGYGEPLRAPVGRIHWAGTETAIEQWGGMDGTISAAERAVGEMLPTEKALAHEFQVSRVTIREALKSLEEEGAIARRAGVGTWVARAAPAESDRRITGPIEEFVRMGFETRTTLLSEGLVAASPEVAACFRQEQGWKVFEAQRLRVVDERPLLLLKTYCPPAIGRKVATISNSSTLYVPTLRALHDPGISEAWQRIEAAAGDDDVAEKLEVAPGTPVLIVKRLFIDTQQKPVVYFVTIYRADRYFYSVKLPRAKRTEAPAHAVPPSHPSGSRGRPRRQGTGRRER